jgi:hypothetical protein
MRHLGVKRQPMKKNKRGMIDAVATDAVDAFTSNTRNTHDNTHESRMDVDVDTAVAVPIDDDAPRSAAKLRKTKDLLYCLKIGGHLDVYKIGITSCFDDRIKAYPRDTEVLFTSSSPCGASMHDCEQTLKRMLSQMFITRQDIGVEYFQAGSQDQFVKLVKAFVHSYRA